LWLRSGSRFGLRGRACLGSWPLHLLWTGLWSWLRSGAVLGLRLTVLRLLGAELRLLRPWLRLLWLDGACLRLERTSLGLLWLNRANLRLVRAIVRLYRTDLRLLWLNWADLRLVEAVVRLDWPHLGLVWAVIRLYGPDLRLARSYLRLTGLNWLDLWPVVWLARTESLLAAGATLGLARTAGSRIRSGVRARDTGLGGDGPGSCDHGWAAAVHVVELLTVLLRFALVLELG
jgi:hypothetical protein